MFESKLEKRIEELEKTIRMQQYEINILKKAVDKERLKEASNIAFINLGRCLCHPLM